MKVTIEDPPRKQIVSIYMLPADLELLDSVRGKYSRGRYLSALLREYSRTLDDEA